MSLLKFPRKRLLPLTFHFALERYCGREFASVLVKHNVSIVPMFFVKLNNN